MSKTIDLTYMKADLALYDKGGLIESIFTLAPTKKSIFQSVIFCFFWTFLITKLLYRTRLDHFMSNMIDVSYVKALVSLLDEGSPFSFFGSTFSLVLAKKGVFRQLFLCLFF